MCVWATPRLSVHLLFLLLLLAHATLVRARTFGPAAVRVLPSLGVAVDAATDTVTLSLRGPADRWFAVGFGGSLMDGSYAVMVDRSGVYEASLGDHTIGRRLAQSVTITRLVEVGGQLDVVVTRGRVGVTADHYTFSTSAADLPVIQSIGRPGDFAKAPTGHERRVAEVLPFAAPGLTLAPGPGPTDYVPYTDRMTAEDTDDDAVHVPLIVALVIAGALLMLTVFAVAWCVRRGRELAREDGAPPPPPSSSASLDTARDMERGDVGGVPVSVDERESRKLSSVAAGEVDMVVETWRPRYAVTEDAETGIVVVEKTLMPVGTAGSPRVRTPVQVYSSPGRVVLVDPPSPVVPHMSSRVGEFTRPFPRRAVVEASPPPRAYSPPLHDFNVYASAPPYSHGLPQNFRGSVSQPRAPSPLREVSRSVSTAPPPRDCADAPPTPLRPPPRVPAGSPVWATDPRASPPPNADPDMDLQARRTRSVSFSVPRAQDVHAGARVPGASTTPPAAGDSDTFPCRSRAPPQSALRRSPSAPPPVRPHAHLKMLPASPTHASPRVPSSSASTVSPPSGGSSPCELSASPRRSVSPCRALPEAAQRLRRHRAMQSVMDETREVLERVERNQRLLGAMSP